MTIDLKTATAQEIIDAIHADCVPRTAALALTAQLDELVSEIHGWARSGRVPGAHLLDFVRLAEQIALRS